MIARFGLSAFVLILTGCGVPRFDIPHDAKGNPKVSTIVERIQCELAYLVQGGDSQYIHRSSFMLGHYQVAVNLSLDVADTGELSPNFAFPVDSTLMYNVGFKLSKRRTQNFSEKLLFSMDEIYEDWKADPDIANCPAADTNLAGELGIRHFVTMAMESENLNLASGPDKGGAFGGSIEFAVVQNVNSLGATWTLQTFKGPGNFAALQRVNTDKVTLAFAAAGPADADPAEASDRAQDFLNLLLLDQLRFR